MLGDFDNWSFPDLVRELNSIECTLEYVYGGISRELNEEDRIEQKRLRGRWLEVISALVKKLADKIN